MPLSADLCAPGSVTMTPKLGDPRPTLEVASLFRAFRPTLYERAVLTPTYTPTIERGRQHMSSSPFSNSTPLPPLDEDRLWHGPHISIWNKQGESEPHDQQFSQANSFRTAIHDRSYAGLNTPVHTPSTFTTSSLTKSISQNNFQGHNDLRYVGNNQHTGNITPNWRMAAQIPTLETTTPSIDDTPSDAESSARNYDSPIPFSLAAKSQTDMAHILNSRRGYQGTTFNPSRAVTELHTNQSQALPYYAAPTPRVYPNYKGTPTGTGNQVLHLPDSQNCALWIEGIPRKAGVKDVLNAIHNTGRIYSTHITHASGTHTTNAIKLVFFTPESAQLLLSRAHCPRGIIVHGTRLRVRLNRHAYRRHSKPHESRVIRIVGPETLITEVLMRQYINMMMVANVLDIFEIAHMQGMRELEIHFGSLHAQAAAFKSAVEMEPAFLGCVGVGFGVDPCE